MGHFRTNWHFNAKGIADKSNDLMQGFYESGVVIMTGPFGWRLVEQDEDITELERTDCTFFIHVILRGRNPRYQGWILQHDEADLIIEGVIPDFSQKE